MKKLVSGALLLAVMASPALAAKASTTKVGGNVVSVGQTKSYITNGNYAVSIMPSNIGPTIAVFSVDGTGRFETNLENLPKITELPKKSAAGDLTFKNLSNVAATTTDIRSGAIKFDSLRNEDGLTGIIKSLIKTIGTAPTAPDDSIPNDSDVPGDGTDGGNIPGGNGSLGEGDVDANGRLAAIATLPALQATTFGLSFSAIAFADATRAE